MTDHIIIAGVGAFDGSYELNLEDEAFTALEWQWLNKIAGYLPASVGEGFEGGDPMLVVALAVIALHRAGKITREQAFEAGRQLADVPFDGTRIRYEGDETESPPAESQKLPESSQDASVNGDGSKSASGEDSPTLLDLSASGPSPTGSPDSESEFATSPI